MNSTDKSSGPSSCIALFDWKGDIPLEKWFSLANEYFMSVAGHLPNNAYSAESAGREKEIRVGLLAERIKSGKLYESIELYYSSSKIDPPRFWNVAACLYTNTQLGTKSMIFARKDHMETHDSLFERIVVRVSELCAIGYGFGFESAEGKNPIFHAMGISYGESTKNELLSNSLWFSERLRMKGDPAPKNRHLKGYLRDLYSLNVVTPTHLERLISEGRTLKDCIENSTSLGSITQISASCFLWKIPPSDLPEARHWAQGRGLLIHEARESFGTDHS